MLKTVKKLFKAIIIVVGLMSLSVAEDEVIIYAIACDGGIEVGCKYYETLNKEY